MRRRSPPSRSAPPPRPPPSPSTFDASGSSDPDGTIESYSWDFGDGGHASGKTPSHTYSHAGEYTVTLTVTDDEGETGEVAHQVSVADAPPLASFTVGTASPTATQPVSFDASGSSDPDGTITGYSWDFGDGTTGSGAKPSHTYSHAGEYTVTLTVTDDEGETGEVAHQVSVADAPPLASFTVGTASPTATQPVPFDASGSSDPDGTIESYSWDFGDGTTGSGAKPSHTYSHAGEYTVTLTVTDDEGETGEVAHQVSVADAPPLASFTVGTASPTATRRSPSTPPAPATPTARSKATAGTSATADTPAAKRPPIPTATLANTP